MLTALLAVGVSACGSGSSTTASAPAATSTTGAAVAASTTSTGTAGASSAQAQKLTRQARQLITQLATASGELASPHSSQQHRAQQLLAQVHANATQLQSQATTQLAPGNPARRLIIQAAKAAATASNEMQSERVSGAVRQRLLALKGMLSSLSSNLAQLQGQVQQDSVSKLVRQLESLGRQVAASATTTTGG